MLSHDEVKTADWLIRLDSMEKAGWLSPIFEGSTHYDVVHLFQLFKKQHLRTIILFWKKVNRWPYIALGFQICHHLVTSALKSSKTLVEDSNKWVAKDQTLFTNLMLAWPSPSPNHSPTGGSYKLPQSLEFSKPMPRKVTHNNLQQELSTNSNQT